MPISARNLEMLSLLYKETKAPTKTLQLLTVPNTTRMKKCALVLLIFQLSHLSSKTVFGIVNLHQETANPIFYRRIAPELSERAWQSGIECLDGVSKLFFVKSENVTRASNVVIGTAVNMSTPAAEIQDGYLQLMNKMVDKKRVSFKNLFQLRIISDSEAYKKKNKSEQARALLLADFYTIVTDSVERLMELIDNSVSRMSSWNPGARFLVLFNNIESWKLEQIIIMKIYNGMLDRFYIHRIAILFAINAFDYSFTSLDYFSRKACRKVLSRSFGVCSNGSLGNKFWTLKREMDEMQSHKDAYNCTFNACATISAPFVEQDCNTGLELRVVSAVRKRLHLNVNLKCSRLSRGIQARTGTDTDQWTGWLAYLQNGSCDFIVGGYYPDNDVLSHFWASECYFNDRHTWFIKRAKERPEWMALYTIFNQQAWLCFIIMLPLTWFAWYLITRALPEPKSHKETSLIGINNFGVTICVAVNERPICHALRIFWFALALYGMNIVAIYTSRLISVFANPGHMHQIDNLDEVIEAGIPFGGSEESMDWFELDDTWIYDRYNWSDDFEPNTANFLAVARGERVILSGRMYVMQHNISDKVYAFPQNMFSSPLQMIMKPGFPYMTDINKLIRKMRDGGLFEKYIKDFQWNNTILNRIAKMRPDFVETVIVITTRHLEGCFALLIFGLVSSCLIFSLEICFKRPESVKKKQQRRRKLKKRRKRTKKLGDLEVEELSSIKPKHTDTSASILNLKYPFVQNKFGKVNQAYEEQLRFTPKFRRHVFKDIKAYAEHEAFDAYAKKS